MSSKHMCLMCECLMHTANNDGIKAKPHMVILKAPATTAFPHVATLKILSHT